eukprot:1160071-Pelagomonas_calceolata.AAC.9
MHWHILLYKGLLAPYSAMGRYRPLNMQSTARWMPNLCHVQASAAFHALGCLWIRTTRGLA